MNRKWLIAPVAIVLLTLAAYWWYPTPNWPVFDANSSNEPQATIKIDRDFAYHIGDLVTADLYLRQQPDTQIEPSSLAIDGDFEMAAKPQVTTKKEADGAVAYRLRLKLQSFQAQPELSLKGSIGWSTGEKRSQITLPELKLHTSNTWDGRKQLQEGDDPRVPKYWYFGRHVIPLALSSLLFLLLSLVSVISWWRSRPGPKVDKARNAAVELLVRVRSGSATSAEHLALDGLLRERFGVGPIPAKQLDVGKFDWNLIEFLELNAQAIYAQTPPSEIEANRLVRLAEQVLQRWPV